jgi:hypothetical protein
MEALRQRYRLRKYSAFTTEDTEEERMIGSSGELGKKLALAACYWLLATGCWLTHVSTVRGSGWVTARQQKWQTQDPVDFAQGRLFGSGFCTPRTKPSSWGPRISNAEEGALDSPPLRMANTKGGRGNSLLIPC